MDIELTTWTMTWSTTTAVEAAAQSLDNLGVSTKIIVVRLFGFDYYVSNIYCILFCYYFDSDVLIQISKLFILFKSILQKKKLCYPDPQSLLKCKYIICHHGGELIATHYLLCY